MLFFICSLPATWETSNNAHSVAQARKQIVSPLSPTAPSAHNLSPKPELYKFQSVNLFSIPTATCSWEHCHLRPGSLCHPGGNQSHLSEITRSFLFSSTASMIHRINTLAWPLRPFLTWFLLSFATSNSLCPKPLIPNQPASWISLSEWCHLLTSQGILPSKYSQ